MKINFIKKYFILVTIFLSLFLISCSTKKENKVVRLSEVTRSVFYAPQYVAIEMNYFKENGLDVRLSSTEGSDKTMTSILAGQADIGLLGVPSVISVKIQKKENSPILFSQLTKKDGSFLVGRNENFFWEDLKGKSVIAGRRGSTPEMVFEYILKNKNIFKDVNLLNNIKFDLMGIAFTQGVGDYVCLFEPTASKLKDEKSLYILNFLGSECPEIPYTGYCAAEKYINENPNVIQAFTNAIYKAQIWVKNHSAQEIAKIILPYFAETSLEFLTKCTENYLENDVWCTIPTFKENEFEILEDIMQEAGELENKLDFKEVVKNEFALKSIG